MAVGLVPQPSPCPAVWGASRLVPPAWSFHSDLHPLPVLGLLGRCRARGCPSSPSGQQLEARGATCKANCSELMAAAQRGPDAVALGDNVSAEREHHQCSAYRCGEKPEIFHHALTSPLNTLLGRHLLAHRFTSPAFGKQPLPPALRRLKSCIRSSLLTLLQDRSEEQISLLFITEPVTASPSLYSPFPTPALFLTCWSLSPPAQGSFSPPAKRKPYFVAVQVASRNSFRWPTHS